MSQPMAAIGSERRFWRESAARRPLRMAAVCFSCLVSSIAMSPPAFAEEKPAFEWRSIEPGFEFARYELGSPSYIIRPEVFLLRFDLDRFSLDVALPEGFDPKGEARSTDIRTLVRRSGAVAGINANFFDENRRPLGLVAANQRLIQPVHRGGRVLTGIFSIRNALPFIEQRDAFSIGGVSLAVQAGPRLIDGGNVTKLTDADDVSRRSGIAVTRHHQIILYATVLRFPGASLREIQHMLIDPVLDVTDALNFDGGGSSQLFLEQVAGFPGETLISGGDSIPVGLVVKRRGG